ncbi:hypothetical protein C8J57DRAFT_1211608 [Mycena rebaudengoi]|nr:hypothetical protein C8J57DRAFT_1211608 [Mycena rebaudengoi]
MDPFLLGSHISSVLHTLMPTYSQIAARGPAHKVRSSSSAGTELGAHPVTSDHLPALFYGHSNRRGTYFEGIVLYSGVPAMSVDYKPSCVNKPGSQEVLMRPLLELGHGAAPGQSGGAWDTQEITRTRPTVIDASDITVNDIDEEEEIQNDTSYTRGPLSGEQDPQKRVSGTDTTVGNLASVSVAYLIERKSFRQPRPFYTEVLMRSFVPPTCVIPLIRSAWSQAPRCPYTGSKPFLDLRNTIWALIKLLEPFLSSPDDSPLCATAAFLVLRQLLELPQLSDRKNSKVLLRTLRTNHRDFLGTLMRFIAIPKSAAQLSRNFPENAHSVPLCIVSMMFGLLYHVLKHGFKLGHVVRVQVALSEDNDGPAVTKWPLNLAELVLKARTPQSRLSCRGTI